MAGPAEYEVAWSVYGTRTFRAASADDAQRVADEWLEDEHGMTAQVADGWDFRVVGERTVADA